MAFPLLTINEETGKQKQHNDVNPCLQKTVEPSHKQTDRQEHCIQANMLSHIANPHVPISLPPFGLGNCQTQFRIPTTAQSPPAFRTFTLYLIRHGEACHNVLEKAAKQRTKELAIAEGLDDPEILQDLMEEARKAVLNDATLFDASLSQQGRKEATAAREELRQLTQSQGLQPPQQILVSPLSRTLETANVIFPDNDNIHVREELRERCTGKPCDQRESSHALQHRASFKRFSMNRLRAHSLSNLANLVSSDEEDYEEDCDEGVVRATTRQCVSECLEEDKSMLRRRTRHLLPLLAEFDEDSISVVTHKAYLRELERGVFGKPEATEFQNCEIRVYRLRLLTKDQSLDSVERLV